MTQHEQLLEEILDPRPKVKDPSYPVITMMIPTYGRAAKQPEMLNEAVYWCLSQTYPNVEVLVLNDAPNQSIFCKHPQVRVVNLPFRVPDLGSKMNLMVLLSQGSICLPAEDDDISLPNRASQAYRMLCGPTEAYEYWAPKLWVYSVKGLPAVLDGNGHGYTSSAFLRESMLGNHPKAIKGHDGEAAAWAAQNLRCNEAPLTDKRQVSYVYRWGVSPLHLSGHPDPEQAFKDHDPGPEGVFEIVPTKFTDWMEVARRTAEDELRKRV